MRKKWSLNWKLTPIQSTWDSKFFVGKTLLKYRHSSQNIDSIWITCNVTSNHCEMMPDVWRWLHKLNQCGKRRKASNSEHTLDMVHWVENIIHSNCKVRECTHCVFGKLKEHLDGRQFSNNNQIQTAVLRWLWEQGAIFYCQGIERLVEYSNKCLQQLVDYVETLCVVCVS